MKKSRKTIKHRLSSEQHELLARKFGQYHTVNNGWILNKEAFIWLDEQENLKSMIYWGCPHTAPTVWFKKKPFFTTSQMKFLQS